MAFPDTIANETTSVSNSQLPTEDGTSSSLPKWMPLLLGFLAAVGPVSTDVYLPAFPQIEASFNAATGSAGITLSAWMIGLAIGQITMGPVSDRFGRRLPMLLGMIVYTLGSVGCAMATSMTTMCLFRFIAAVSASASIVIPSACVRDLASGQEAAKLMAKLILIQGVVPILAPMLGGVALDYISWRAIFWVSALYGALCVFLLWRLFPETLPEDYRKALRPLSLVHRYVCICRDRLFVTNTLIVAFCGFMSFTYLTAAPNVFEHIFGFTPAHYGMLFGLFAVCMIGSSQVNAVLVNHYTPSKMLGRALICCIIGAIALLVVSMLAGQHLNDEHRVRPIMLIPVVICMMVTLGMTGIIGPNSMVGALTNQAQYAGSATAFAGTLQYILGSLASTTIGMLPANSIVPMAALMLVGALMMGVFATIRPQEGPPSSSA